MFTYRLAYIGILMSLLLATGCSSSASVSRPKLPAEGDSTTPKTATVDQSKPATYAEYKAWRKNNDPAGQTYAEYKNWEIAYKQWQQEQAKVIGEQSLPPQPLGQPTSP
jgi:hypothetical protein